MDCKKYAHAQTQYPKIYGGIYWGGFKEVMEDEIIENRNKLVVDFNIVKGFSHSDRPRYITKMMSRNDSKGFDHTELYKTKDRKYLLITSPYAGEGHEYLIENGWRETYKIYSPSSRTYYKLVPLR